MVFVIEPMRMDDVDDVMNIEHLSFSMPWPVNAYKRELKKPDQTRYVVARNYPTLPQSSKNGDATKPMNWLTTFLPFLFGNTQPISGQRYPVAGYAGLWMIMDEAHITTIAVHPDFRGQGVGELLLIGMIDTALQMGASWLTLEVRVSNIIAQNLYKKYTFKEEGRRPRYYTDNDEDAFIMTTAPINTAEFQRMYAERKRDLIERFNQRYANHAAPEGS